MTQQLVSESLTPHFTRLGRDAATSADDLGPLADLVGKWLGSDGVELIAVPDMSGDKESFRLILRPYIEVFTVSPIGAPVPNRGGPAGDMFINGVMYDIRITDAVTKEPLHLENGMWLYMGEGQEPAVARLASIPHGDAFVAVGDATTVEGPPTIVDRSALPVSGPETPFGYTDPYLSLGSGFDPSNFNSTLQATIKDQNIVQTTTLSVATENGGGISNIPFVDRNATATAFFCDFWIETVQAANGQRFQQLQYSQQTNIQFMPTFGGAPGSLIMWPHTNVATLVKQ
jgi:hypothetical protein